MKHEVAKFGVLSSDGETTLPTVVEHHVDETTGYNLITITQYNEDDTVDCVCLSPEDLRALIEHVKGH